MPELHLTYIFDAKESNQDAIGIYAICLKFLIASQEKVIASINVNVII